MLDAGSGGALGRCTLPCAVHGGSRRSDGVNEVGWMMGSGGATFGAGGTAKGCAAPGNGVVYGPTEPTWVRPTKQDGRMAKGQRGRRLRCWRP